MGCSGSKPLGDMKPETAEDAYAAAANPEIAGQVLNTSNEYGLQEGSREAILEEIFEQCDDDKSGSLDLSEFGQLFHNAVTALATEKFNEIDSELQRDGSITKREFVQYHISKFSKLNDTLFAEITQRLLKKAEDTVVLDGVTQAPAAAEPAELEAYKKFKDSGGGEAEGEVEDVNKKVDVASVGTDHIDDAAVGVATVVMT